jgi:hypothetical protein
MPQHVLAESFDDFVVSEVLRNLVVATVLVVFVKLLEAAALRCVVPLCEEFFSRMTEW